MYQVSEAFREAMKRPVQHFRLRGKIYVGVSSYIFTEENIQKGSFSITNQCSGSDIVEIGSVYTAELDSTFVNMELPKGRLEGARIVPELQLLTDEGYEGVPLGVFLIGEANWTSWGIEVVAYDYMTKFDKKLSLSSSAGRLYDFLLMACRTCGVELGMTRDEVNLMVNGQQDLAIYEDNDIETWRDLISWVAQTAAAFATIDRQGRLVLRTYETEPVDTIDDYHRIKGAKFSDFETRYTGMSCVNIEEGTTTYYGLQPDDGLTYNLGQNPLLQYGLEETLAGQRKAILNQISKIRYVPMDVSMLGNPAYDLGDVLVFSGGIADADKISCITKYDWTYGREYAVTGVGKNPALSSAKSKTDKDISGLLAKTEGDAIHYYDYLNATDIHISDGESAQVINFRYVTTKVTHVDFHAEIKYRLSTTEIEDEETDSYGDTDGVIKVTYFLNGDEVTEYKPVETMLDGDHLLHLLFTWQSSANIIGFFEVHLEMQGGSIDIEQQSVRAYIAGQGLAGDDAWDGTVRVEDEFPVTTFDMAYALPLFSAAVDISLKQPTRSGLTDVVKALDMALVLKDFSGAVTAASRLHRFDVNYSASIMEYDGVIASGTVWRLDADHSNGTLTTPNCQTDRVLRITSRHSGDDVAYIVSFDGGEKWWTYVTDWREPDYTQDVYGMFEGTMRNIPEERWAEKLQGTIMVRAILVEAATVSDIQIYTEDIDLC